MIAHLAETFFQRFLPGDVTPAQFGVLNRLARLDEKETVTQLAKAFMVTQPTMSSTTKKLAEKGYIVFNETPEDKRARYVAITKKGERKRQQIVESLQPVYERYRTLKGDSDWTPMLEALYGLRTHLEEIVYD